MSKKQRIVYTSGTFDMFHSNHLKMLKYAKGISDVLIVGVSTDELVCTYKNPPTIPFEERLAIVEALRYPDIVIPQHSLEHSELVRKLNVDAFVIGDDWDAKYDYLKDCGVEVYYFPYGDGVSSSKLKEKIYRNYNELKTKVDKHNNPSII